MNPLAVSPVSTTAAEATARSIRFRLLGFYPCESPLRARRVISTPTAGCSPGFFPFQGFPTTALIEIPPDLLSRASPFLLPEGRGGRRLRVSIGSRLALSSLADESADMDKTALLGFLHLSVPEHSSELPLGLCFHLLLSRALLSTCQ